MSNYTYEHRTVKPILDAIANWVNKYRHAIGMEGDLARCGAEEVALVARDIGVSPGELIFIANKGPHAADELPKLLSALGVDPQSLTLLQSEVCNAFALAAVTKISANTI